MRADNLSRLMQLSGTSNASLARALAFDPSYISRIRRGKRGIPRNHPFLEPAAALFARKFARNKDLARSAAAMIIGDGSWPEDLEEAEALIIRFLTDDGPAQAGRVLNVFQQGFTRRTGQAVQIPGGPETVLSQAPVPDVGDQPLFLFGNQGKRQAVLAFLTEVVQCSPLPDLLLYSDESMEWLIENHVFVQEWMALMAAFLGKGGKIRIIHSLRRGVGEMIDALEKWMPLYMTGRIEPYYLPRLRDGILRRTLFIAEGTLAIAAHSVGDRTEDMPNAVLRDPAMLASLEKEFMELLSLARPLLTVIAPGDAESRAELREQILACDGPPAVERTLHGSVHILAREDCGVLITQSDDAPAFYLREQNIVQTILTYLASFSDTGWHQS